MNVTPEGLRVFGFKAQAFTDSDARLKDWMRVRHTGVESNLVVRKTSFSAQVPEGFHAQYEPHTGVLSGPCSSFLLSRLCSWPSLGLRSQGERPRSESCRAPTAKRGHADSKGRPAVSDETVDCDLCMLGWHPEE